MVKINTKQEWKILKFETYENKPAKTPYPEGVVKRRGLLLLAQCLLADYAMAESEFKKKLVGGLYLETKELYFSYKSRWSKKMDEWLEMITFCKSAYDCYDEHKIDTHIPRPNGKT